MEGTAKMQLATAEGKLAKGGTLGVTNDANCTDEENFTFLEIHS